MANERTDPLTLSIGGISVKGQLKTDLDTGVGKWYPISGPTGPFPVLGDKYLTSTKDANGNWTGWTPVNDVFGEIRNQNSQISAAYGTTDKLATAFYISGTGVGSPTGTLNSGRLNQFNTYGAPQTAKNLKIPGTTNTATQTSTQTQTQTQSQTLIGTDDLQQKQIEADSKETAWRGKIYRYPTKIDDNKQDFIKFEVYDYKTRRPSKENPLIQEKNRSLGSSIATIVLPIQPSITDNNTVDWNGLGLNPVELAGYGISSAAMTGGSNGNDFGEILGKLGNTVTQDPNTQKAILLYLKQRAIGVNGLLSRFGGAIVNPNTELLFQGPQLRPFSFSFRLSPRDKDEAKQVKSIIRIFKEAMSVKTASGGLFLATPNVFKIKYINGTTKEEHTSLNKIKTCALQSCSVDYTPDGSYMTFNDTESGYPMTSYNLTLQFQELEPVTDTDYKSLKDVTTIGY